MKPESEEEKFKCSCVCHALTKNNNQPEGMCDGCLSHFKEGEQRGRKELEKELEARIHVCYDQAKVNEWKRQGREEALEEVEKELESHANCQNQCLSKKRTEAWDVNYEIACLGVLATRIEALKKKEMK